MNPHKCMLGSVAGTQLELTGSWLFLETGMEILVCFSLEAVSCGTGTRYWSLTMTRNSSYCHWLYYRSMNYQNRTTLSHAAIVYQNLSQVWRFDTPVVPIATLWSNFYIQLLILNALCTVLAVLVTKSHEFLWEQLESFIPVGKMWKICNFPKI